MIIHQLATIKLGQQDVAYVVGHYEVHGEYLRIHSDWLFYVAAAFH